MTSAAAAAIASATATATAPATGPSPGPGGGAAISVRDLRKTYRGRDAVRGVSFDVAPGEVFGFLGPNGAGKTTTIEILEGYRRAHARARSGCWASTPAAPTRRWRERIGLVLQECELDPNLTVRETVALFASFYPHPARSTRRSSSPASAISATTASARCPAGRSAAADVALGDRGRPRPGLPRRAHHRLRSLGPAGRLGDDRRAARARQDDPAHHPLHGRGAAPGGPDRDPARRRARRVRQLEEIGCRATAPTPSCTSGCPAGVIAEEIASVAATPVDLSRRPRDDPQPADPQPVLYRLTTWAEPEGRRLDGLEVLRPTLEDVFLELTTSEADHVLTGASCSFRSGHSS